MATWFTADNHFFHSRIIIHCKRPFAYVEEMDRAMEDGWRALVRPWDTVYHLGDFAFGSPHVVARLLASLPGRKVLVKGNHDRGFKKLTGPGMFEEVHDQLTLRLGTREVLLCHYPYCPSSLELEQAKAEGYEIRYLDRRPKDRGMVLLCGHIHNRWLWRGRALNVGVDVHNFKPIGEGQVLDMISERVRGFE